MVTFWQALPKARYSEVDQQTQFFDKLLAKLTSLPGIENAGMVSPLPFSGNNQGRTFTIVGQPAPAQGMEPSASLLTTDGAYFRTMRIPLKNGRTFDARDRKDSTPVVMINETFAQKYFPHENPLGQRLDIGGSAEGKPREIVGVVGTAKHGSLAEAEKRSFTFPLRKIPMVTWTLSCARAPRADRSRDDDSPHGARDRCATIRAHNHSALATRQPDALAIAL